MATSMESPARVSPASLLADQMSALNIEFVQEDRERPAMHNLPTEILLMFAGHLQRTRDIRALTRVNHRFHSTFTECIYKHSIKHDNCFGLSWAAIYGDEALAVAFLEAKAPVDAEFQGEQLGKVRGRRGCSFIHDLGYGLKGQTPLHLAIINGHQHLVELLVSRGADAQRPTVPGLEPLRLALCWRREAIARVLGARVPVEDLSSLRNHGSSIRALPYVGCAAVHIGASYGLAEFVRFCLDKGVDVDVKDSRGHTPLHYLLSRERLVRITRNLSMWKTIDLIRRPASEEEIEMLLVLLLTGADVNKQAHNGNTAMAYMRYWNDPRVTLLMTEASHHCKNSPSDAPEALKRLLEERMLRYRRKMTVRSPAKVTAEGADGSHVDASDVLLFDQASTRDIMKGLSTVYWQDPVEAQVPPRHSGGYWSAWLDSIGKWLRWSK